MNNVSGSERAVVAALFRLDGVNRQYAASQIAQTVTEDDFSDAYYAVAYRVVSGLVNQNVAPTPTAIRERLTEEYSRFISGTGNDGPAALAQMVLSQLTAESHECRTNYGYHARRIAKHAALRRAKQTADEYAARLQEYIDGSAPELNADDVIAEMQQAVMGLSTGSDSESDGPTALSDLVPQFMQEFEERWSDPNRNGINGLRTAYPTLNRFTRGFGPGHLIVLAAMSGKGKSALALNLGESLCDLNDHAPGQIFSYEMMQFENIERMLYAKAKIGQHLYDTKNGLGDIEWAHLRGAARRLAQMPIDIHDAAEMTVSRIAAKCRAMAYRGRCKWAIVDYTQIVPPDANAFRKGMASTRENEVAQIIGGLKRLAVELKIPIIALSQLNDNGQVRESRKIKNDANVMLILERQQEPANVADANAEGLEYRLTVDKCRHGSEGQIPMVYYPSQTRFEEKDFGKF